ncbi:MAG: LysM peptidoglycan-binding domain-containing protein [Proteobacteria bacterium]|nr:LysM peptidoglycan-binding domain-containing protein [Pseudomonadota bacterium]MBU1686187.1 LysM peptidoglycan-binding domain-containing protein [Pseudomonadota bacterium]
MISFSHNRLDQKSCAAEASNWFRCFLLFLFWTALIFVGGCSSLQHRETVETQEQYLTLEYENDEDLVNANETIEEESSPDLDLNLVSQEETPDESLLLITEGLSNEGLDEQLPPPSEQTEIKGLEAVGTWDEGQPIPPPEETVVSDFPVVMNRQVQYYIDYFQNSQPEAFTIWLQRSGRYLPMIREELNKAGLPMDLAYLPMIESGYNLTAFSRSKAVGPWQFMKATARMYGLTINNYIDERRDPIKSTRAAVTFLKDLHRELNSWHLAVAAYNGGLGRLRKAIRKSGSANFWEVAQGNTLKTETKRYVPKLIAAIIIAKNPEKYGFNDIEYDPPLAFETLDVPRWTTMQAVAVALDEPLETIHNLNRQLRRAITPPGNPTYTLRIPTNKKDLLARNLPRVKALVTTDYKTHEVAKGDTVTRICNRYNINKKTLLKANNLRSASLTNGQRLRIPFTTTSYKLLTEEELMARRGVGLEVAENLVLHTVLPGESTSVLARRYNVPLHMIAAWNNLDDLGHIKAGQQLAFYLEASGDDGPQENISQADQSDEESIAILGGHGPMTAKSAPTNGDDSIYYEVQGGDTLWDIAKKYQITPALIRRWNSLDGDLIRPGKRLLLNLADLDV